MEPAALPTESFELIVVGGGHAGCEAALTAARLGISTALVLGRPLSQKTQEGFFRIGMFLLVSLMFFTTFNDLKDLGLFN